VGVDSDEPSQYFPKSAPKYLTVQLPEVSWRQDYIRNTYFGLTPVATSVYLCLNSPDIECTLGPSTAHKDAVNNSIPQQRVRCRL